MILDGILGLLYGLLSPIVSALPRGHLPESVGTVWNGFSGWVGSIDYLVPVAAPFQFVVGLVASTVPAFITYRVAVFIFNKVRGS